MPDSSIVAALAESAVEVLAPAGTSPLLLLCEHAGAEIPAPWSGLGLDPAFLATHYAYDPGAGLVTRRLSASLDAPAVLARYSRIFLDYNRFVDDWDYIRTDLGGIPVPGNLAVDDDERIRREAVAVAPVRGTVESLRAGRKAAVSIHSFTPVMAGERRPVDVAILWDEDSAFVRLAREELMARAGRFGLRAGDNAPYDLRKVGARSLKTHAADHGLPYFYVEVNNGLFSNPETADDVTALLDETLSAVLRREVEWNSVHAP
jgi:predicted N-formylglutamate amidohydrolase